MNRKKEHTHCNDCPAKHRGIFCNAIEDHLNTITQHKVTNKYKKGQTLFIQGNHPYGLYCICKGNIKLTKTGPDGKESIVRIATAGDVLGHRSLFTDDNYTATATAMEESQVCFLDKKFIVKAIQDMPTVALNIINKLSREMGAAENKLTSLHQKNVRERLAELLLILKETHGTKSGDRWRIDLKLTREEMAEMIGTASETLIRFISEFKENKIIEQEGKVIFIIDEEKLTDWANF